MCDDQLLNIRFGNHDRTCGGQRRAWPRRPSEAQRKRHREPCGRGRQVFLPTAKLVPTAQTSIARRRSRAEQLSSPSCMYLPDKMDDDGRAMTAGANIIVAAQPPPPPVVNAHRNRRFLCGAYSPIKNKDGSEKQRRRPLVFCLLMAASLLVLFIIAIVLLLNSLGAKAPSATTADAVNSANDSFSSTTFKPPPFIDSPPTDQPPPSYTSSIVTEVHPTAPAIAINSAEDDSLIDQLAENDALAECQSELKHRKCPAIRPSTGSLSGAIESELQVALAGHLSGFRPVRYQLNLTIAREQPVTFAGGVDILLRAVVNTKRIVVHTESSTQIDFGSVRVYRCSGINICIRSIVHDPDSQMVAFELGEPVEQSQLVRLTIAHFDGKETQGGGIHSHNARPPAWQQGKAWVVGTVFQMRFARKIFPCLDHPALKARLALCLRHPANTEGRSNMPATSIVALNETNSVETCFQETPSMSTHNSTG
uniref:Aminopeptidase N-like N-terminal domain-containing protein n=1 Tax=Plectus sambesii TaxID=2011161 RepID=A0A914XMI3_9BILA